MEFQESETKKCDLRRKESEKKAKTKTTTKKQLKMES